MVEDYKEIVISSEEDEEAGYTLEDLLDDYVQDEEEEELSDENDPENSELSEQSVASDEEENELSAQYEGSDVTDEDDEPFYFEDDQNMLDANDMDHTLLEVYYQFFNIG